MWRAVSFYAFFKSLLTFFFRIAVKIIPIVANAKTPLAIKNPIACWRVLYCTCKFAAVSATKQLNR